MVSRITRRRSSTRQDSDSDKPETTQPKQPPRQLALPLPDSERWEQLLTPADFLDPVTAW